MSERRGADMLVSGPDVAGIPYRHVVLGLVCLSTYLGAIDNSIVNIALPTLAAEFETTTANVIWATLIFILVSTGLALIMGRLGDLYGRKALFAGGLVLFTAATGLSAIAGTLPELLGARVVQAVGTAMVTANGAAIVTATFPGWRRGAALGMVAGAVGAGVATGPVLGGILIDTLDWRALFWTRVPFGVLGSVLVWRFLVDTPPHRRPRGMDLPGSFVLFAMLTSLVLAVNRGAAWGWSSVSIVALFVGGVLLVGAFIWIEKRAPSPVVALDLFRKRSFSGGVASAVMQFMGLSTVSVLMPFYLVDARGFSTLEAGGIIAALPIAMLLVSPFSGALSDRIGPRLLTTTGLMSVTLGMGLMATIDTDTSVAGIVLRLTLVGIGNAMFSSPNTSSIMASVSADRLGTASAAQMTARTIGNAIGVAMGTALFTAQALAFAEARSPLGLDDLAIRSEALVSGLQLAWTVAAAITAGAIFVSWSRGDEEPPQALAPVETGEEDGEGGGS